MVKMLASKKFTFRCEFCEKVHATWLHVTPPAVFWNVTLVFFVLFTPKFSLLSGYLSKIVGFITVMLLDGVTLVICMHIHVFVEEDLWKQTLSKVKTFVTSRQRVERPFQRAIECSIWWSNRCPTGEAVVTDAFNLPCKYIIHTAGPIFKLKPEEEALQKLRMCYINCLNKAQEKEVKKIAFPAISCGLFGAPAEKAAQTAIFSVQEHLTTYKSCVQEVWFVLLEYSLFDVYKELADENFEVEEED